MHPIKKKVSKAYFMFDEDATGVNLDMHVDDIPRFDFMWRSGHSIDEIAYVLRKTAIEMELLAMDRFLRGKIEPRSGHMQGTIPWEEPSDKIRVEA